MGSILSSRTKEFRDLTPHTGNSPVSERSRRELRRQVLTRTPSIQSMKLPKVECNLLFCIYTKHIWFNEKCPLILEYQTRNIPPVALTTCQMKSRIKYEMFHKKFLAKECHILWGIHIHIRICAKKLIINRRLIFFYRSTYEMKSCCTWLYCFEPWKSWNWMKINM